MRPRRRSRLRLVPLALVIGALVGLVVAYVIAMIAGDISPRRTDFITYFTAGSLVLHGHGGDIYTFSRLAPAEKVVVYPFRLRYGVLPYVYPPYFAVLLAPAARLTVEQAYAVWSAISLAILAGVTLSIQRLTGLRGQSAFFLWLATAAFLPVFIGLLQGQPAALLLGLFTAVFFSLQRRADLLAGSLLALALVKPPYVLPVLLILLVFRRWRALAAFCAVAAVLAAVPTVLLGPSTNTGFLHVLKLATTWRSQFGYGPQLNSSLAGPVQAVLPGSAGTAVVVVLDLLVLGGLWLAARRSETLEAPFALAVIAGLLISPHVLIHDLTLLVLPAGIALSLPSARSNRVVTLLAAGYVIILVGFATATFLHVELAILATFALAWWLWRQTAMDDSSSSEMPSMEAAGGS